MPVILAVFILAFGVSSGYFIHREESKIPNYVVVQKPCDCDCEKEKEKEIKK